MLAWKKPNKNGVSYAYLPNEKPIGVVRYLGNNAYEWEIMSLGAGCERYGKTNTRKLAQDALELAWMRWIKEMGLAYVGAGEGLDHSAIDDKIEYYIMDRRQKAHKLAFPFPMSQDAANRISCVLSVYFLQSLTEKEQFDRVNGERGMAFVDKWIPPKK